MSGINLLDDLKNRMPELADKNPFSKRYSSVANDPIQIENTNSNNVKRNGSQNFLNVGSNSKRNRFANKFAGTETIALTKKHILKL
jgi:hypothetical protein